MGEPIVTFDKCSKWYGHVLGVSEISVDIPRGVIGLLGPNGAGKSTMIKLMSGLIRPSLGAVTVFGDAPSDSLEARRRLGYCHEHESAYDELTALEFVTAMAELSGMPSKDAAGAADTALARMGMSPAKDRVIRGFSKGMRQRTKLAQALVHDPELVLLDEPLTGVDPVGRQEIVNLVRRLGEAGKTVVISSHILKEIESVTDQIIVIYRGQVLAEGNIYRIRELIDHHPHRIRVECARPRELARGLTVEDHVARIQFDREALVVETRDPDRCYDRIAELALTGDNRIDALTSPDNNLAAVFEYLTGGIG